LKEKYDLGQRVPFAMSVYGHLNLRNAFRFASFSLCAFSMRCSISFFSSLASWSSTGMNLQVARCSFLKEIRVPFASDYKKNGVISVSNAFENN